MTTEGVLVAARYARLPVARKLTLFAVTVLETVLTVVPCTTRTPVASATTTSELSGEKSAATALLMFSVVTVFALALYKTVRLPEPPSRTNVPLGETASTVPGALLTVLVKVLLVALTTMRPLADPKYALAP